MVELFLEQLASKCPAKEELEPMSENMKEHFIGSFLAQRKNFAEVQNSYRFQTEKLLAHYDCSKLEIGMISFLPSVLKENQFLFFGKFEQDRIAIDTKTDKVIVMEYSNDHIIWDCALNEQRFFNAIVYCAGVLIQPLRVGQDEGLLMSKRANEALEASKRAGLEASLDFYEVLLGAELG